MRIEQIIQEKNREQFYNYYKSLGYDHKTAAALALFTYGRYRFDKFSIDDLYEALCRGEEYLPPEVLDARRRRENQMRRSYSSRPLDYASSANTSASFPAPPSMKTGAAAAPGKKERGIFSKLASSIKSKAPEKSNFAAEDADCGGYEGVSFSASAAPMGYGAPPLMSESPSMAKDSASYMLAPPSMAGYSAFPMPAQAPSIMNSSASFYSTPARGSVPLDPAGAMGYATDEYEQIEEKDARSTVAEPTSTFRMTTNTASAGVILNQLRNERRIDKSMVRIEEMLNYFRYESTLPGDDMFSLSYELMDAGNRKKYLYIHVQGRIEVKDRQNIIILLDVSGSMSGNAEQTQAIIATVLSKLGNGDKLSLITYSTDDHVEIEAFTVNGYEDRIRVLEKLLSIEINGCTYGSAGIETAYKIGKKNYIKDGNNQVILITDGDLNFGITDTGGLEELIEQKKKDNLFLSVIGTGLFNYKDDKLEVLCKHGNGVYRTVNSLTDVKKSIDEEYSSLVNIIAKDVKAQVEFNPEVVESYRLLGFENRTLAREDFTNDKVISEPFGSGGYGVALYELTMKTDDAPAESGLKYSRLVTTGSKEAGTIKVRYKEPLAEVSHEIEKIITSAEASFTDNLRLAFIVYVCAEKLRGSDRISSEEIALAKKLYAELGSTIREMNSADLFKLAGILEKSESELGIGIRERRFPW